MRTVRYASTGHAVCRTVCERYIRCYVSTGQWGACGPPLQFPTVNNGSGFAIRRIAYGTSVADMGYHVI
eukprot:3307621-Rhodomonas_salina.1